RVLELPGELGDERRQVADLAEPAEPRERGHEVVAAADLDHLRTEVPRRSAELAAQSRERLRLLGPQVHNRRIGRILRRSSPYHPAGSTWWRCRCLDGRSVPPGSAGRSRNRTERGFAQCPSSACENSWKPESTSATRRAAGTRRCAVSSSPSGA